MIDPFGERPVLETEVLGPEDVLYGLSKPKVDPDEISLKHLVTLEEEVYRKHLENVEAIADWADLPEDATEPPDAWLGQDPDKAARRFRIAQAAGLPKAKAPVGLTLSVAVTSSIAKARAARTQAPVTNNLTVVELTVAPREYTRKLVKADER